MFVDGAGNIGLIFHGQRILKRQQRKLRTVSAR